MGIKHFAILLMAFPNVALSQTHDGSHGSTPSAYAGEETRLIKSGKFKDVQRANVKLAVRFMLDNYRLNDAFVTASAYLEGSSARRVEAGQVGQRAVQNLYTILEYFDASDVQNIKVC